MANERKSDEEKKITGTARNDRRAPDVLDLPLNKIPKTPKEFTEHQIEFYNDECDFLLSVNALTRNRIKRVQLGSMWWHLYKVSSEELRNKHLVTYATGAQQISPEVTVLDKSTRWLQSYFTDRDKMKAIPKKKVNELDALTNG